MQFAMLASRETDLGGNEIVEVGVVQSRIVWEIEKALYGLRTSPIAWETERNNTLQSLTWIHDKMECRLLPCPGSPCLCSVISFRPGDDLHVKASRSEFTQGIVITYVDDLLVTGWQHHIDAITKALMLKYVMKSSGSFLYDEQGEKSTSRESEGVDFLGAKITRDVDGTVWCDQSKYIRHCHRDNEFVGADESVSLKRIHTLPSVDENLAKRREPPKKIMMPWLCVGVSWTDDVADHKN